MKNFLAALVGVLTASLVYAQPPAGANRGGFAPANGKFYGKVVDQKNKGIDAASIQLYILKFDPATQSTKDSLVGGMLTKSNGNFEVGGLPLNGKFKLYITAIGYEDQTNEVSFNFNPSSGQMPNTEVDLGNIKLEAGAKTLETVTVTASKPLLEMGIDRKIFNVEKSINATGGTAIDVMRTVPSVDVDIEGNVSLRNSAPTIFVDGRPTTLTLDQIPSDAIQSIEIITNPSAKYDASGGQSGILNIVMKKSRKTGYNGSIRAGIDSYGKLNGGGDINVRQGKVNLFANLGYNQRKSKNWGETDRTQFADGDIINTYQRTDGENLGGFLFSRFGLDFMIDNRNTITVTQSIMRGNFDNENYNRLNIDTSGTHNNFISQYRNTFSEFEMRNMGTQIGYKRLFTKPGRELTADLTYNYGKNVNNSDIFSRNYADAGHHTPISNELLQGVRGNGKNDFIVAQIDYVSPINDFMKWEGGLRLQSRNFESLQQNYFNGVLNPGLTNDYAYVDNVYAAYATFSQNVKDSWSYQVGLRAESSNYDGEQKGIGKFKNEFPISLFPSVFINKRITDYQDFQVNYSRKINRPSFFQLMPNTDYSDPLNYSTGNPDLVPEFTNSLELSYQWTYGKSNNMVLATLFGKHTNNLITRYQKYEIIGNDFDTAYISTFINASDAYASGLELIFRNNITKFWETNLGSNLYYSKINGTSSMPDIENERWSWTMKLNNNFRFNKGWSFQLNGDYKSKSALAVSTSNSGQGGGFGGGGRGPMGGGPSSTSQGYIGANYGVDLGVRKEFKLGNNQASLSVNWSDILRSRKMIIHSEAIGMIQDEWRRRDPQVVRATFSLRFGKFDQSLFKRKNNRQEMDSGDMNM
ncbi:TonB-dependent receptor family protein [Gynurincola endophyticus]|uniref:TonB-dependent receptor family protein n=1 Tax=Gynurincola endophyticus TaxID=2479004 RepID=UPI000F8E89AF|nr:TonB-dependent receptor family protein [Gynurincola endophyticus]